jgi:hypothetical protein
MFYDVRVLKFLLLSIFREAHLEEYILLLEKLPLLKNRSWTQKSKNQSCSLYPFEFLTHPLGSPYLYNMDVYHFILQCRTTFDDLIIVWRRRILKHSSFWEQVSLYHPRFDQNKTISISINLVEKYQLLWEQNFHDILIL